MKFSFKFILLLLTIGPMTESCFALNKEKSQGLSQDFSLVHFWKDFDFAQTEYLQGDLKNAFQKFVHLTQKYSSFDSMNSKERKLVHYAFLRAAQLAPNKNKKKDLLFKAHLYDSQLAPDPEIFPPQFIDVYRKSLPPSPPLNLKPVSLKKQSPLPVTPTSTPPEIKSSSPARFWVYLGVTALSLFAGFKIYEHNQPRPEKIQHLPTIETQRL